MACLVLELKSTEDQSYLFSSGSWIFAFTQHHASKQNKLFSCIDATLIHCINPLIGWFFGWLAGPLFGWLVGWWIGWLHSGFKLYEMDAFIP